MPLPCERFSGPSLRKRVPQLVCLATLASAELPDEVWLVASQSRSLRLGKRDVFRALPRDESAVAAALERRRTVGGQLGRAYDELAELLLIDAS